MAKRPRRGSPFSHSGNMHALRWRPISSVHFQAISRSSAAGYSAISRSRSGVCSSNSSQSMWPTHVGLVVTPLQWWATAYSWSRTLKESIQMSVWGKASMQSSSFVFSIFTPPCAKRYAALGHMRIIRLFPPVRKRCSRGKAKPHGARPCGKVRKGGQKFSG